MRIVFSLLLRPRGFNMSIFALLIWVVYGIALPPVLRTASGGSKHNIDVFSCSVEICTYCATHNNATSSAFTMGASPNNNLRALLPHRQLQHLGLGTGPISTKRVRLRRLSHKTGSLAYRSIPTYPALRDRLHI
jgi:hypothetical protein